MTKNPGRARKGSSHPVNYVSMFRNEIEILQSLTHPNVVKLVEYFEDRQYLYAIMEKCDGGELFTKIVQRRKFSEPETARLCKDMLSAIGYIHSQDIVHRDVKAENFLFSRTATPISKLVLIDFGMSVKLADPTKHLRQVCGSPHYVAPELIKRLYRKEVDLWALGIVIFLMLYGRYPFEGSDQKQIAQKILKSEPDFARTTTPPSPTAISFIKGLLEKDPSKRLSSEDALSHPWIQQMGVSLEINRIADQRLAPKSFVTSADHNLVSVYDASPMSTGTECSEDDERADTVPDILGATRDMSEPPESCDGSNHDYTGADLLSDEEENEGLAKHYRSAPAHKHRQPPSSSSTRSVKLQSAAAHVSKLRRERAARANAVMKLQAAQVGTGRFR